MRHRLRSVSLPWRVSLANATVLVVATTALALAPGVTVSIPIKLTELVILVPPPEPVDAVTGSATTPATHEDNRHLDGRTLHALR